MKQCTKCKVWKDKSEFGKDNHTKSGLRARCKSCRNEDNRDSYHNNKEKRSKSIKKWQNNNKSIILEKEKILLLSKVSYKSYFKKLSQYEECRIDPNNSNLLQIKCKCCGDWINPLTKDVKRRLGCIKGTILGDSYIFCSKDCENLFKNKLTDEDILQYKFYRRKLNNNLEFIYRNLKNIINPLNLPRGNGKNKYHIDHILSAMFGFLNKVPIEVMNNPFNLRMLECSKNLSKFDKSDISLEELYDRYKVFIFFMNLK